MHHTTPGLSNEKGSGLGLMLCKEFIEKNGGEITITSEPQKGTTITFSLKKFTA
jgi:signal transduction histidine kinase